MVDKKGFIVNDSLDACEAKFRKQYAAASILLFAQPLTLDDIYSIALCLRRLLPASVAQYVIPFAS